MASLSRKLATWLRKLEDQYILAGMSAGDIADIGMTPAGMTALVVLPADVRERMEAMAAVFGLGADRLHAERWRAFDMIQACGHCPHRRACAVALARPEVTPDHCAFCPNAAAYRELASASREPLDNARH